MIEIFLIVALALICTFIMMAGFSVMEDGEIGGILLVILGFLFAIGGAIVIAEEMGSDYVESIPCDQSAKIEVLVSIDNVDGNLKYTYSTEKGVYVSNKLMKTGKEVKIKDYVCPEKTLAAETLIEVDQDPELEWVLEEIPLYFQETPVLIEATGVFIDGEEIFVKPISGCKNSKFEIVNGVVKEATCLDETKPETTQELKALPIDAEVAEKEEAVVRKVVNQEPVYAEPLNEDATEIMDSPLKAFLKKVYGGIDSPIEVAEE